MRIRIICLFLLLCLVLSCSVSATSSEDYVADRAQVLPEQDVLYLQELLSDISQKYGISVLAVTTRSVGSSIESFAEEEYFSRSSTPSGVILVLLFSDYGNQYYFYATDVFYDIMEPKGFDELEDVCAPLLKSGDYAGAFEAFALTTEALILDPPVASSDKLITLPRILICIAIGAILSFAIPMSILSSRLRSVRSQSGASEYIRKGSLVLTANTDRFLYRNVTRVPRAQNTSSGRSIGGGSGGSRGGGRGGGF